jgi:hypothetical protein
MTPRILKITATAAFALFTLPTAADAEEDSPLMHTRELCEMCAPFSAEWERTKDPTGSGQALVTAICHSFITGVLSYEVLLVGTGERDADICPPPGFLVVDAKRVFLKYCENHPEAAPYNASSSLMGALQAAYPCKKH